MLQEYGLLASDLNVDCAAGQVSHGWEGLTLPAAGEPGEKRYLVKLYSASDTYFYAYAFPQEGGNRRQYRFPGTSSSSLARTGRLQISCGSGTKTETLQPAKKPTILNAIECCRLAALASGVVTGPSTSGGESHPAAGVQRPSSNITDL